MDYIEMAILELEKRNGISAGFAREQYAALKLRAGVGSRPTPLAVDGELPCLACGGEVGHRINCPHGIAFTPSTATKA